MSAASPQILRLAATAGILGICPALAPLARGQINLLLNGSFEAPSIGGSAVQQGTPFDWSSTGATEYLISNGGSPNILPATNGNQVFYFFSDSIAQGAIDLAAGQTYQLTFDLSKFLSLGSGAVTATVSDGVDTQAQSFAVSSSAWSGESWSFTAANSGDYILTLAAGVGTYPAIDNAALVEYSAVPEPSTYGAYCGTATVLLAAAMKRRATAWSASCVRRRLPARSIR